MVSTVTDLGCQPVSATHLASMGGVRCLVPRGALGGAIENWLGGERKAEHAHIAASPGSSVLPGLYLEVSAGTEQRPGPTCPARSCEACFRPLGCSLARTCDRSRQQRSVLRLLENFK